MTVFIITVVVVLFIVILTGRKNNKATHQQQEKQKQQPKPKHDPLYIERMEMLKQLAEQRGDTEAVRAIIEDRYDELAESRAIKKQAATAPSFASYSFNIAGINFRHGISEYVGKSEGVLKPQPTNRHDPNAIAVYSYDNHHLGYIPADETDDVRNLHLRFPIPVAVQIEECYDSTDHRFFVGTVTIKVKSKI